MNETQKALGTAAAVHESAAPVSAPSTARDRATTERLVLDLLIDAATAHGIHEKDDLGGVYDDQWPQWYAAHITKSLAERGYRLSAVDAAP